MFKANDLPAMLQEIQRFYTPKIIANQYKNLSTAEMEEHLWMMQLLLAAKRLENPKKYSDEELINSLQFLQSTLAAKSAASVSVATTPSPTTELKPKTSHYEPGIENNPNHANPRKNTDKRSDPLRQGLQNLTLLKAPTKTNKKQSSAIISPIR